MGIPNTFTSGTVIDSGQVNENFSYVNQLYVGSSNVFETVGSSTAGLAAGSFVIPAGSLSETCVIDVWSQTSTTVANAGWVSYHLSGTDFGASKNLSFAASGGNNKVRMQGTGYLSLGGGYISAFLHSSSDGTVQTVTPEVAFDNFTCSPNSGLVVLFTARNSANVTLTGGGVRFTNPS